MQQVSVITISGLPGTGTTTAAVAIARTLGFTYVNQGSLFRAMAQEHGLSLNDFGVYASTHPEIDHELDRRQVELARGGSIVLEGRLAGFMVNRAGIPACKVLFKTAPEIRWQRISGREGISLEEAAAKNQAREKTERDRFLVFYGFDLYSEEIYDLIVDTGLHDIPATQRLVLEKWQGLGCR